MSRTHSNQRWTACTSMVFALTACDRATALPSGCVLSPGHYLLIVSGDEQAASLDSCTHVQATWRINHLRGETLFLVHPNSGSNSAAAYPPAATRGGGSWARVPDARGNFAVAYPTPGEPNQAVVSSSFAAMLGARFAH